MASHQSLIYDYASPGEILAACIVLPVLGILTVGLRFIARSRQGTFVGKDDVTILLGLFCVFGMAIIIIYGTAKGAIGYPTPKSSSFDPTQNSEPAAVSLTFKLAFYFWLPTTLAFSFIRLSVLFFYRRLFLVHSKSFFDIASRLLIWTVILWTLVFVFMTMFYCGLNFPIDGDIIGCLPITTIFVAYTASDIALDVLIWILPMPIVRFLSHGQASSLIIAKIWKLRTSKTRKFLVTGIFLLASISLIAAIIRFVVNIEDVVQDPLEDGTPIEGADIDLTLSLYWSLIQAGIALIASCLPIIHNLEFRVLIKALVKRIRRPTYDSLHSSFRPWNRSKPTREGGTPSFTRLVTNEYLPKSDRSKNTSLPISNLEMTRRGPPTLPTPAKEPARAAKSIDVPLRGEGDWRFGLPSTLAEGRTAMPVPALAPAGNTPSRSRNQGKIVGESWV
ncbi:hypothetical protein MMC10_008248 [Thelotrema lepadinum]|nr:hypothetical protein [Thelotrema lepadinum]